jgi:hypothetical protein
MTYKKMIDRFDLPLSNTDFLLYSSDTEEEPIECLYSGDAKAIALAVNNHDKLVELLEGVKKVVDDSDMWWMDCPDRGGIDLEAIDAALQAIKGDQ